MVLLLIAFVRRVTFTDFNCWRRNMGNISFYIVLYQIQSKSLTVSWLQIQCLILQQSLAHCWRSNSTNKSISHSFIPTFYRYTVFKIVIQSQFFLSPLMNLSRVSLGSSFCVASKCLKNLIIFFCVIKMLFKLASAVSQYVHVLINTNSLGHNPQVCKICTPIMPFFHCSW